MREEDDSGDREQAHCDQRPRPVAPVANRRRHDRVLLALVGHDEHGREVDDEAGAAEQCQYDEADPEERGVDLEVARQSPAHAGQHAVGAAALQRLDRRSLECVLVHGFRIAERVRDGYRE